MRIHETTGLIPHRILLMQTSLTDLHRRRRIIVDALALAEYLNHDLTQREGSGVELGLLPCLDRIEDDHIFVLGEGLFFKADKVRPNLSRLLVINTDDLLVAEEMHASL